MTRRAVRSTLPILLGVAAVAATVSLSAASARDRGPVVISPDAAGADE